MKIRVLSIDGGGIRGIAPAHMLARLEQKLLDSGKLKVADSFELFVGTSTGCIVAAGLAASGQAAQPLAPKDIEQLYHTHGQASLLCRAEHHTHQLLLQLRVDESARSV